MTNEEMTNHDLLELFKRICMYSAPGDGDLILEIQEEIFLRMEDQ